MLQQLSFETSAVRANFPQVVTKSCKTFTRLCGEKRMQAILSDIEPGGGSGAEPYSLPADVEFVFMLAGRLELTVAGQLITLDQGDAFTFPGSTGHTFQVPAGTGPARVLWVFSPALPDSPSWPGGLGPDRPGAI